MGTIKWLAISLQSRKRGIVLSEWAGAGTPTALLGVRSNVTYYCGTKRSTA